MYLNCDSGTMHRLRVLMSLKTAVQEADKHRIVLEEHETCAGRCTSAKARSVAQC